MGRNHNPVGRVSEIHVVIVNTYESGLEKIDLVENPWCLPGNFEIKFCQFEEFIFNFFK